MDALPGGIALYHSAVEPQHMERRHPWNRLALPCNHKLWTETFAYSPDATQNLVKQRLSTPEALQRVGIVCRTATFASRTQPQGMPRVRFLPSDVHSSCNAALGVLATDGALPTSRGGGGRRVRRNPEPVPLATDVPERLVEGLQLVPVRNPAQSAVWMMITEHPLGKSVLVSCQCRYLVGSAHGWLGAVDFAASARRLAARDNRLGRQDAGAAPSPHRRAEPLSGPASSAAVTGVEHVAKDDGAGLRGTLRPSPLVGGDLCRPGTRASRSVRRTGFM